jgi:3-phenylpropionate/cinnamic acid dioxygenase small subunit
MSVTDKITRLIHHEARLLDEQRYDEWIALYTADCRYWVPVSASQKSPREGPSHFHDDIQVMKTRVHRLANPRVFGAEPAPRTVHIISGIEVEESGGMITASSGQIMLEYRNRDGFHEDQRMFGGRVTHHFQAHNDRFLIALKRIDLINAEGSFNAMAAPL